MSAPETARPKRRYLRSVAPKFDSESAKEFSGFSVRNAEQLAHELTCECEPYVDIFTLPRWNAQGYKVRKGEHSHAIGVRRVVDYIEEGDTEEKVHTTSSERTAHVFCRCQVEPMPAGWVARSVQRLG